VIVFSHDRLPFYGRRRGSFKRVDPDALYNRRMRWMALVLLALPVTARAQSYWEAGVAGSYLASGDHRGFGAAATMLRSAGHVFALGATFDVARLSTEGTARNNLPYRYAYSSMLLAGVVRARLQLGRVQPYVEVALGTTIVEGITSINTACSYESGLGAGAGAGVKVDLPDGVAVGLRAAVRQPAGGVSCLDINRPYTFSLAPLYSLGFTADFFW
jgi:hypothetical protein